MYRTLHRCYHIQAALDELSVPERRRALELELVLREGLKEVGRGGVGEGGRGGVGWGGKVQRWGAREGGRTAQVHPYFCTNA